MVRVSKEIPRGIKAEKRVKEYLRAPISKDRGKPIDEIALQIGRFASKGGGLGSNPTSLLHLSFGGFPMNVHAQAEKAEQFRKLHHGPRMLVLANAWDVVSARILEEYGHPVKDMAETVKAAIDAGAIGMNLEDVTGDDESSHVALPLQVEKIRAIRETAKSLGVPFVLNARTDVYLMPIGAEATRFERTVERLRAYRDAGADCLFAPGIYDRETIAKLVRAVEAPVNILASPACPPMAELEKIGVARLSAGSGIMRAAMGAVQRIGKEMLQARSCETMFAGAIPYAELNRMMNRRANEANA